MVEPAVIVDWSQAVIWICVLVCIVYWVIKFFRMPADEQVRLIKECLLNWVVKAETELGSGTGKVKLSDVYGQFVKAFPILKNVVSFETFSEWVDEALDQMREMLRTNPNLREAVGVSEQGGKNDSE